MKQACPTNMVWMSGAQMVLIALLFVLPGFATHPALAADATVDSAVPVTRPMLAARYKQAVANKNWPEAERAAQDMLTLVEAARGPNDQEVVGPLLSLASAQTDAGKAESARANLVRAGNVLESRLPVDPGLLYLRDVLYARTFVAEGDHAKALDLLSRAVRSAQKTGNIHPETTSRAFSLMLESAMAMQDQRRGNAVVGEMLDMEAAGYGEDSVDRVPGLYAGAGWYHWSGQFSRERDVLGEAVRLVEKKFGPTDSRLSLPLRTIATSYILAHDDPDKARDVLDRALTLPMEPTTADIIERSRVLAVLGDHAVVFGSTSSGTAHYTEAWQTIARYPELGPKVANQYFGNPAILYLSIPSEPFQGTKGGQHYGAGRLTFGFTVTADGLVDEPKIIEKALPSQSLPGPIVQAFRRARYRPRVIDGVPVATSGQEFRFQFDASR